MNKDKELSRILDDIARKIFEEKIYKYKITVKNEHGVYIKTRKGWVLYRKEGDPFKIGELGDKIYIIYFDNTRCPACRMFDPVWWSFIKKH